MKFTGYEVTNLQDGLVAIRRVELDETELTAASDWMEGYSNSDPSDGLWVGRDLDTALAEIRRRIF